MIERGIVYAWISMVCVCDGGGVDGGGRGGVAGEGKGEVVDDGGVCGEVEVEVDIDVGVIEEGGVRNPTSPSSIPSTPVTPAAPAVAVGGSGGKAGGVLTKGGVLDLAPKSDANPDVNLDAPPPTPVPAPPPPLAPALRSGDAFGLGLVWE
jgi:hypothetical protein